MQPGDRSSGGAISSSLPCRGAIMDEKNGSTHERRTHCCSTVGGSPGPATRTPIDLKEVVVSDARIRVLIVEDEAAHAAAIRRAFESSGTDAAIEVVGSLREFRERSVSSPPDIAVMDLTLPDGRDVDVLTKQREDGAFPILIMTSLGNEQTAVDVLKAGAMDYVVKSPETFSALSLTVTRTLREWNLLLERERDTDRRQDCDAGGPV